MLASELLAALERLEEEAVAALAATIDGEGLSAWKVAYLGKKARVGQLLRSVVEVESSQRPSVGQAANACRRRLEERFEARRTEIEQASIALAGSDRIDVTLPGRPVSLGQVHPVTRVLREILDVFVAMGFQVVEGPEVEWDYYNFEALNIPQDHPARDTIDTFYISRGGQRGDMLLRTHTSPNQIRVMEASKPPVRVVVPGKCYRYEATDPTHESMFFQVEGLAVDTSITMADLKGTLTTFAHRLFGSERKVRFRTDYFPFVEPGVDFSIDCYVCRGKGCRLCGGSGWLEILGAGMVHPNVLRGVGYDPEVYTGFAFGLGPERIAMLKYGIDDIRLFYANDLRFLRQFK